MLMVGVPMDSDGAAAGVCDLPWPAIPMPAAAPAATAKIAIHLPLPPCFDAFESLEMATRGSSELDDVAGEGCGLALSTPGCRGVAALASRFEI